MAGAMNVAEGWEMDPPIDDVNIGEKHAGALKMKEDVKEWMHMKGYMFETGISYPERRLKIYLQPDTGKAIQEGLLISGIEGIPEEADFVELKGDRKRLAMYPGRTAVYIGDGSSATLGTFLRDRDSQKMYALTSEHTGINVMQRDVFVRVGESIYRLGKVVANVKQKSPVIEACLIEVDVENQAMCKEINLAMFFTEPDPPLYLKMYEYADKLGIEGAVRLQVSKYGYSTGGTFGTIVEYARDLIEDGHLLTDNIVTKSNNVNMPFAAAGDSGSIVFRSIRSPRENINFYDAISMLYMADDETGESFSIPLPRCLSKLGEEINNANLELATENPAFFLNLNS